MENCHYPHGGVDAEQHGCKTTEYKNTDSPLSSTVMYCVRVSLRIVKIFLAQHYCTKEGVVGNLFLSLDLPMLIVSM
jgi:hypothetical protein